MSKEPTIDEIIFEQAILRDFGSSTGRGDGSGIFDVKADTRFLDGAKESIRRACAPLITALECEIKMVKHAGYNPHFSEAVLEKFKIEANIPGENAIEAEVQVPE